MAMTFDNPAGTFVWPKFGHEPGVFVSAPHATTVPSSRNARLCASPAAIATTFVAAEHEFVWPAEFFAQATTVPSLRSASEWSPPPAMATASESVAGTLVCPAVLRPQAITWLAWTRAVRQSSAALIARARRKQV